MTESLPLDGRSLTLEQFLAVTRGGCAVSLTPEARSAVASSRRAVERALGSGRPIYGINTGFGGLSHQMIPPDQGRQLQLSLLRSHASGTGPALPAEIVRGLMLARLNSLARGLSGVGVELLERLVDLLNQGLVPLIPEQGSVGASGDLAPLAHLGLALTGEGAFVARSGAPEPANDVLRREGIAPYAFAEKEGVALINGTSLLCAYLGLSVADARVLLAAAEIAAAVSFDALRGNPAVLDERLGELKNLPEQVRVARAVQTLLKDSELAVPAGSAPGQDPYTLRCIPQVLAAVELGIGFAEGIVRNELNAVSDNPVVLEGDEFLNGGNFHGENLALALDTLALVVQYVTAFSERRIARLLHPALNRGLPPFLAPTPGLSSGFMIPQYLAAALVNENVTLSHPASVSSLPTSADQEDFVSMGAWAGQKLRRMLTNAQRVVAVEWIVAVQALEFRRPKKAGRGSEAALRALREFVSPWSEDRSPSPDIERTAARIADGSLVDRVRGEVPF